MSDTSQPGVPFSERRFPDPHGQAALLLVESLLHGLLVRGVLTLEDALAITTSASEIKEEVIANHREPADLGRYSLELIDKIAASLGIDAAENRPGSSSNDL